MASYKQAIEMAPADADYIGYANSNNSYVVITRDNKGAWDVIANCNGFAFAMIICGIRETGKSFYNADIAAFECGTIEQIHRDFNPVKE